jgi:hypothetical protein
MLKPDMNAAENRTLHVLRRGLAAIFVLAVTGTLAELLLLEHFDSAAQLIPMAILPLSLLVLGWYGLERSARSLTAFRYMMFLLMLAGAVGLFMHFNGNRLFELSVTPEMKGMDLFWKAMTGATPALAPGSLVQIGLVGLAFTFRHPVFKYNKSPDNHGAQK